jgi:hypothetical protein
MRVDLIGFSLLISKKGEPFLDMTNPQPTVKRMTEPHKRAK